MVEPLQPRRERMLRHLAERAAAAGLRSSQTAHHHLRKLEEEGYLVREAGRAKKIWLTDKGWEAVGRMALMGRIAAGRGLEAVATDEAPPDGALIVALLHDGEEVTVKRICREDGELRLRPENGDHEELVLPAEDVRVQGRVVYVVHPPRNRAAGGGA